MIQAILTHFHCFDVFSKKIRINLNKPLQTIDKETTERVQKTTDEGRKYVVEVSISLPRDYSVNIFV